MHKIGAVAKKYKELILYVVFGALTTAVSVGSFWLFDRLLGQTQYLLSNALSWVAAVAFAYVTNKLWVFEAKGWQRTQVVKELSGFVGARLFSLALEEVGLWLLLDRLHFGRFGFDVFGLHVDGNLLAKILLQLVVLVLNYVFSKFVIFAKRRTIKKEK